MHVPYAAQSGAFGPPLGTTKKTSSGVSVGSAAFRSIVFDYCEGVHNIMWALLGSRALAMEASIGTFARGYGQVEESAQPWLVLLRLGVAEGRRLRLKATFYRVLSLFKVSGRGGREAMLRLLGRLSWSDRVLLVLREVGGLSLAQVAFVVGRREEDVRADLFVARQHLLQLTKGTINEKRI